MGSITQSQVPMYSFLFGIGTGIEQSSSGIKLRGGCLKNLLLINLHTIYIIIELVLKSFSKLQ